MQSVREVPVWCGFLNACNLLSAQQCDFKKNNKYIFKKYTRSLFFLDWSAEPLLECFQYAMMLSMETETFYAWGLATVAKV